MAIFNSRLVGVGILLVCAAPTLTASGLLKKHAHPACEPGYQWVEETIYTDVERLVCKIVPEVKKIKKYVYSTVDDPFCLHRSGESPWKLPFAHHCKDGSCHKPDCGTCANQDCCKGPYCRKQLVKKEVVTEEHTTKCVVEKVVEKVACVVLKKVACDPNAVLPPPAPPLVIVPPAPETKPETKEPVEIKQLPKK